jgi:AcrR family transcriptional regulator
VRSRTYQSPKRDAIAQKTRDHLIAAASRLLASRSKADGFSLDAVAKAAKVTRITVYNQFGSRRALLEAVFDNRAAKGGLNNIAEAMGNPDPHGGLMRLIAIFCTFWGSNRIAIGRITSASRDDPDLEASLRERNERRRRALSVLVGRMAQPKNIAAPATADFIDVLFALTGLGFFAELQNGKRTPEEVCKLIQTLADELLRAYGYKS